MGMRVTLFSGRMLVLDRKRLFGTWGSALLLAFATGCFATAPAADQKARVLGAESCLTPEDADRMADRVLQLINLERGKRDLQPVMVNPNLTKIAERYCCSMVSAGFFGHRDPATGYGPAERAVAGKYAFFAIGENLAAGPETAGEVMKLWMDSPSHRAIIIDPTWAEVGVAVRAGGEHSFYWVQEFGDPAGFRHPS